MKSDSPSFEEQQFTRAQHRISIRRLLNRDKTPLAILLAAAVGTLAGLVGVAFEKAVNAVLNWRVGTVAGFADSRMAGLGGAFGLSALFAMVGYFLVRKFARRPAGRASRKLKVRWKSCARCAGGG
jgi:CIC family chloride channel protein